MNEKIIIKFWRIKNVVCMQILQQPTVTKHGVIWYTTGFQIKGGSHSGIASSDSIVIKSGLNVEDPTVRTSAFGSEETAQTFIHNALIAIRDFNISQEEKIKETSDDVQVVIAQ